MTPLVWRRVNERTWFSSDGAYLIRHIEWIPNTRGAYVARYQPSELPDVWLPVGESTTMRTARECVETHRWKLAQPPQSQLLATLEEGEHVVASTRFFFPISNGTDSAALVVERGPAPDYNLEISVLGVVREADDATAIGTYATVIVPRDVEDSA